MMNTEKNVKLTKKDFFAALRLMVENMDMVGEIPADEVLAFIDKSVSQIDNKAAKAREKASEKRVAGDRLYEIVVSVLTSELQTIDVITAAVENAIGDENIEVTKAKVTARLTQAFKNDIANKEQVKNGSRRVVAYVLKNEVETDAEVETEEEIVTE